MPKLDPNSGDPEAWMQFAMDDVRQAKEHPAGLYNLTGPCFHAQQAAEKALKAVCLAKAIRFGVTHDLGTLEQLLEDNGVDTTEEVFDAIRLSSYATARYPSMRNDLPTEADLDEAVRLAQGVIVWASRVMGLDVDPS